MRCPYVIDRLGGGYLQCVKEEGHDDRHNHGRTGREARRAIGDSWVTLEQWRATWERHT